MGLIKMLIYSGTDDSILPFNGTLNSIEKMGLKIVYEWSKYYLSEKQVGGYYVVYDNMVFATVRGSGHEVPKDRPEAAYNIIDKFIKN